MHWVRTKSFVNQFGTTAPKASRWISKSEGKAAYSPTALRKSSAGSLPVETSVNGQLNSRGFVTRRTP